VGACCELGQPRIQTGRLLCALLQDGTSSMHEKLSQIGVPAFADPEQFLLTPGGMLSRTIPIQAANSRPLWKAAPLPIAR
jgi:hypothetical protein